MSRAEYTLVTGGAGFVGSNVAHALLSRGEPVLVLDNLSRAGVEQNLEWLQQRHGDLLQVEVAQVEDAARLRPLVARARQVVHLAAQVAVTTSVEDPAQDLRSNLLGTFHLLEALRALPRPVPLLFTSTNKVYGALGQRAVEKQGARYVYADGRRGIDEGEPLDFHSPYGCSKGAADQYVLDYARIYDLPTAVFRMSCIYGRRQFGTEDQGWVAHFARSLLGEQPITIYGDGCQVRDILWIDDLVRAVLTTLERLHEAPQGVQGEAFNIGGGPENAVTVSGVVERLREITGRSVPVAMDAWRPGDQRIFVSETRKAEQTLGWSPEVPWQQGLAQLVEWLESARLSTPVHPLHPRRAAAGASR